MKKQRKDFWPADDDRWSDQELYESILYHRVQYHRPFWDRQATVIA